MPVDLSAPSRRPASPLSSSVTVVPQPQTTVPRRKRVVRVDLAPELLEALADEAEERDTTAPLLIAMLLRERAEG